MLLGLHAPDFHMHGAFLWLSIKALLSRMWSLLCSSLPWQCGRWQDCSLPWLHGKEAKQEEQMGYNKEKQAGELVCCSSTGQEQQRIFGV